VKRCRACRKSFEPRNTLQAVCSPTCAIQYAGTEQAKRAVIRAERQATKAYREATATIPQLTKLAQAAFNRYIRHRDAGLPCVSCGAMPEPKRGGTMDCGHYRSVGACPQLRFCDFNAAAQCVRCNRDLSGNTVAYRLGLLERIGASRLAWLEGPHPVRKFTRDELRELRTHFDELTKSLRRDAA